MNKENVLAVADAIEQHSIPDLGFNMGDFCSDHYPDRSGHNCGTTACIAGWACALQGIPRQLTHPFDAEEWMGLTGKQSSDLFYAAGFRGGPMTHIEPAQAARVLRHLAETGIVDWSVADQPEVA